MTDFRVLEFGGTPRTSVFKRGTHCQKQKMSNNPQQLGNGATCKIGYKLVLFTNRKSHTSFRMAPKSLSLNYLEWRNGRYFVLLYGIRYP